MDLTVINPIKFNVVPNPNSIFTCTFKLKGTTEKIKVDVGLYIYHRTIPSSTDILSVIENVYTDTIDKVYTVELTVPNFDPQKRANSHLSIFLHPPLSFNTKIQIEDINFEKPDFDAVLNVPNPNITINNTFQTNGKMNIVCEGLMLGHSGFAKAMRNVTYNLDKLGCNVKSLILDQDSIKSAQTLIGKRVIQLSADTSVITSKNNKFWITMNYPLGVTKHAGFYSIAYIMFETVDFPQEFVNHIKSKGLDEIWTPSSFCRDSMIKAGLTNIPIIVMPLGVDTEMFNPIKADEPRYIPGNLSNMSGKFKFLSVMGYSERKGVNILIRAFVEEFGLGNNGNDKNKVALYFKGGWYDTNKAHAEINNMIKDIPLPNRPLIHIDFNIYPDDILASLYKACNVFVLPSRGEGWSLPCCEAMSMGLPTISTRWSGNLDFMDDNNSYLINIDGHAVEPRCNWITSHYINQKFAIPSKDHLKQLMRYVYEHKQEASQKGEKARKFMVENYDWKVSCQRMESRIEEIIKTL